MVQMVGGWYYDELRQIGTDFENLAEVEAYDARQSWSAAEDDAILDRLGVGPGQVVVDLGAGTGRFALRAAQRGATVHAVDVSAAMVRFAEQRATATGASGIAFHRAGFLSYHHQDAPADVVVSKFALHHLPDFWKQAALLRVAAMLRPSGQFFLRDVVFSFPATAYAVGVETWIASVARADGTGWSRTDFETHIREEHSTYGWIMEGLIEQAGLIIEEADYPTLAYANYWCRKPT